MRYSERVTPEQLAGVGDDADVALQRGDLERALSLYTQLESHEPNNARWAGAIALVLRKLGRRGEEVEALARVARIHLDSGDTLRAIATLKHVLALMPEHAGARRALATLSARHAQQTARPPVVRGLPATDEFRPLDQVSLRQVVSTAARHRGQSRVHHIPIGGEDEAALTISGGRALPPVARPLPPEEDFSIEEALVADVAAEVRTAARAQAVLPNLSLFASLDAASVDQLISSARLVEAQPGQEVFHQGDAADALYIVAQGLVGVVDEGPPRRGVAKLEAGEMFGEIAILTERPRSATVVAIRASELLAIDRAVIQRLIASTPDVLLAMLGFMRDRLIGRLVATHPLFSVLSPGDAERMRSRLRFLEVEPGGVLIAADKPADALYVILSGRAVVVSDERVLAALESGDIAGEGALLTGQPPAAVVRAETQCWVIALDAGDFRKIVDARPEARAYVEAVMASRSRRVRWG